MAQGTNTFLPRRLETAWSRAAAGSAGARALLASMVGNPAYANWFDDYYGDQIGELYPASVGTGTQVITVTNTFRGGRLDITTDTNANDTVGQAFGFHWRPAERIYYHCRAKLDNTATASFEIGLTDTGGNADTGPIVTKATPTFNATDAAMMCFDTNEDTNVTFITANAGVVGANADAANSAQLANDTYFTVEIVVDGGFASGYFNGVYVGGGAITSTAVLTPYVYARTRTTAARTLGVDYQGIVSPRQTASN